MICLRCQTRMARTRGQCDNCRRNTKKAIARGQTSEAAEIAAGRMLVAKDKRIFTLNCFAKVPQ